MYGIEYGRFNTVLDQKDFRGFIFNALCLICRLTLNPLTKPNILLSKITQNIFSIRRMPHGHFSVRF